MHKVVEYMVKRMTKKEVYNYLGKYGYVSHEGTRNDCPKDIGLPQKSAACIKVFSSKQECVDCWRDSTCDLTHERE